MRALLLLIGLLGVLPYARDSHAGTRDRPDPEVAKAFIREGVVEAVAIFSAHSLPREEIARQLRASLRQRFSIGTIAGFAIGVHRRRLNSDQRRRYVRAFEDLLVEILSSRILIYGPRETGDLREVLKIKGTVPVGRRDLLVRCELVHPSGGGVDMDWRVRMRHGKPQIIDLTIAGISQAQTLRQEFASVIQQRGKGIDGLIEAMEEKNASLRGEPLRRGG